MVWWLVAGLVLASCGRSSSELEACLAAEVSKDTTADAICERSWDSTFDERVVSVGARLAMIRQDEPSLLKWTARAANDVEGARALYFLASFYVSRGDGNAAEPLLRRALALRVDRDPGRASNTALMLFDLERSNATAEESIRLARLAWEQANHGDHDVAKAFATVCLVDLMLDLGEIHTAIALAASIDQTKFPALSDLTKGKVEAARGHFGLAASLLTRVVQAADSDEGTYKSAGTFELVDALLDANQLSAARSAFDKGGALEQENPYEVADSTCRFAAVRARLELREGKPAAARATVDEALKTTCRDTARAAVLEAQGDVFAAGGFATDAEHAWHSAADTLESWRISIPSIVLRRGIVARHRRALERWLDSVGKRCDAIGAVDVADRLLGRALRDRLLDREPTMTDTRTDEMLGGLLDRLADSRASGSIAPHSLGATSADLIAFLDGERTVWSLRHFRGAWSIRAVGGREDVDQAIEAYQGDIDNVSAAEKLGALLFTDEEISGSQPLTVMLDSDLANVPFGGLRVEHRYLVERADLVEVIAPELLFANSPQKWTSPIVLADPLGDLPAALQEGVHAGAELDVKPLIAGEATRRSLLAAHRSRVLHVASHSNTEHGRAVLELADGSITASEIMAAHLEPRVAVIASCDSKGGEDPMGSLVSAFLASGAHFVIGTKRAVNDSDTAALIRDFYQAGGDKHPIAALAKAQRRAIAHGIRPSAWAALTCFGGGLSDE